MPKNAQEELDLEVEIRRNQKTTFLKKLSNDNDRSSDDDDQFKKAESSTQKRIDRFDQERCETARDEKRKKLFDTLNSVQAESAYNLNSRMQYILTCKLCVKSIRNPCCLRKCNRGGELLKARAMELGDTSAPR